MITTQSTINLASQVAPPIIQAVQGDTGRAVSFALADYTVPDGATATYYIAKPSGEAVYNTATISGNNIICELTAQSLAELGENNMQVRIIKDEDIVTSFDVILLVRPFRGIDAIESDTEMNIFDKAVEKAAEDFQTQAEQIVEEVVESIPADYTELTEEVSELNERLGDLDELETSDKTDLVSAINEVASGSSGTGLTEEIRQALLQLASKVAYIDDDGLDYYNDLYDALYAVTSIVLNTSSLSISTIGATSQLIATTEPEGVNVVWASSNPLVATVDNTGLVESVAYGSATITATAGSLSASCSVLVSQATCTGISATYTQTNTVYDTDNLDSLKIDLVVSASWSDGTTSILTDADYILSGTLEEGTSVITVAYGGNTATFNVIVVHSDLPSGYTKYDYITYDYALGTLNIYNAIITDIAMSSDYILETEFSFTNDGGGSAVQTECIMGSRVGGSGAKEIALFANRTTLKCGYWYGGTDTTKTFNYVSGSINRLVIQPVGVSQTYPNNVTIKLNGTDYNTGSTSTGTTWSAWFSFFGYGTGANTAEKSTNKYNLKLGRTTIKDLNGNILYDFIPAYQNGADYGLYEIINSRFYTGQNASHFICGNWE